MEGNGRTKRGAMDPSFTQRKKAEETEWIKTLQIAYPYGMNDKLANETTVNKDELIRSQFLPLKRKYPCARGNKQVKTNVVSCKNVLHKLNVQLIYNLA